MDRRSFLRGMAGILATGFAPAVVGSGVLMPVRTIWTPPEKDFHAFTEIYNFSGARAKQEMQRICGMPLPYVSVVPHDPRDLLLAQNMAMHINRTLQRTGMPFLSDDFVYEDAKRKLIGEAEAIMDDVRRARNPT